MQCNGRDFEHEEMLLKEYGFFCHMVLDDKETKSGANFHTHGLPKSVNHPDIQLVIALPPKVFGPIIHSVYNFIKEGNKLVIGKLYDEFLNGYNVQFAWATENGRDVLRMILPDKQGETDFSKISLPYAYQWEGTNKNPVNGTFEDM